MLIKCPECGKEISDKAISCPNCGYPMAAPAPVQETGVKEKKRVRNGKPSRLPNGFGTVAHLRGKRAKPYQAIVTLGWELNPDTGRAKRKTLSLGTFASRAEALQALADYHESPQNYGAKVTLAVVYARWSDEYFPTLSASSVKSYEAAWKICAPIADRLIKDIKLDDLQTVADNSDKNLPTLQKYKILCSQLFEYAVIHEYIAPAADKTSFINLKKFSNPDTRPHVRFTSTELETIWEWQRSSENDTRCYVLLMLIYTGVRISEMLNLKKSDVNLSERWFDVTAAKTGAGVRKVPIANKVLPFFEYWYNLNDCPFLLNADNKCINYDYFRRNWWEPLMSQLGINHLAHDTRHTCASLLAEAQIDKMRINKIMGHSGEDVGEQVYTHFEIASLLDAINKI